MVAAERNVQAIKEVDDDGEVKVDLQSLEELTATADAGGEIGLLRQADTMT